MGVKRKLTKAVQREVYIEEVFQDYLAEKKALNKSPATITSAMGSFKRWYEYLESKAFSLLMKDVEPTYVYSFCNHFLNEDMKPTTLNHYLRDIRAFLYWTMEKNYIEKFAIKMVKEQEVIKETYSDEEKLRLIARPANSASFVEWRTWAIVNWILATGNRASTVCSIKLGDINYRKREIVINKSKTNKALILPLSPALATVLTEYVRRWRAESGDNAFLFPNIGDEELTVNALKHSIAKYNRDRDVAITSVHALRHTFAKDCIRNTGDVFRLQKMLQHSTLEMTRRYVNMFSEDLKEGFEEYNPLDKLKKNSSRTQRVKRTD